MYRPLSYRLALLALFGVNCLRAQTGIPAGIGQETTRAERCASAIRATLPILTPEEAHRVLVAETEKTPLKAVVDRKLGGEPYLDFTVEEGDKFGARLMMGSKLLEIDWTNDQGNLLLQVSQALTLCQRVGQRVDKIEGYATDNLGKLIAQGKWDNERASKLFTRLRRTEKWEFTLEKRGERTYLVGIRKE